MSLSDKLREYVTAAFSGIWVQTFEQEDALREVAALCRQQEWALATWDVDRGLNVPGQAAANTASDPVVAIKSVNALATPDGSALLVLPNFHRFLQSTEVMQALAHQVQQGKTNRTFVLVLSPVVQIPVELEKAFVVVEHDLPDKPQLQKIAKGIATEKGELPEGEGRKRLIDASAALTNLAEFFGRFRSLNVRSNADLDPMLVDAPRRPILRGQGREVRT